MSGVKRVLQGMGALGQVVCDMGFSTCTVSIVTYILYGLFFQKNKSVCVKTLKLFVSVCIAQYTAYGIQYPADSKKVFFLSFKKGKCVEKVWKKWGIRGSENVV